MTGHYVLVVRTDDGSAAALESRPAIAGFDLVFTSRNVLALTSGAMDFVKFPSGSGLLVGEIFPRHGPPRPLTQIDGHTQAALQRANLAPLISSYWGGYVGAIEAQRGPIVFRDPSAALPCYYARTDGAVVFASDVRSLLAMVARKGRISGEGLAQYLYSATLPSTQTALDDVRELLPGTMICLGSPTPVPEPIWSPWDHVMARHDRSLNENAESLRRLVGSCVTAMTRRFERPLVSISGGLDSSIVAACVAQTGACCAGLTMYTDDPAGDERHYSKVACDAFGFELIERRYDITDIDIDKPESPHLPRPVGRTQGQAYERALLSAARDRNVDVFVTGNGGDNVFANLGSAKFALDRYLAEGMTRGTLLSALDIADLTATSLWKVIGAALRAYRNRRSGYQWKAGSRFLHADLVASLEATALDHHWLIAPKAALPGQLLHVAALLRVQQSLSPGRSAFAPVINPLLAQPIVEFSLSVPTWQWCAGGRDRAVARAAFDDILPPLVSQRRVKGTPDSFSAQIIAHFRDGIRERLLDGHLCRQKIIDRESLETVLDQPADAHAGDRSRILDLLDTEAWVNHWLGAAGDDCPPLLDVSRRSSSQ